MEVGGKFRCLAEMPFSNLVLTCFGFGGTKESFCSKAANTIEEHK